MISTTRQAPQAGRTTAKVTADQALLDDMPNISLDWLFISNIRPGGLARPVRFSPLG